MIYQELVTEIRELPLVEQLSLMETLSQFISRRMVKSTPVPANSLTRVRGMLKPTADERIPTDAELADDYTDYLMKKYA